MSWSSPRTWVTGEIVTAAEMNTEIRDNLNYLSNTQAALVDTTETTTSTSYVDLTTTGPSVTLTTNAHALVIISVRSFNSAASNSNLISVAISGATTQAAVDVNSATITSSVASGTLSAVFAKVIPLTAGSNTFKLQYRTTAGTASFLNRNLTVVPLP